jgi:methionine salvage enolase-phosphatase E1
MRATADLCFMTVLKNILKNKSSQRMKIILTDIEGTTTPISFDVLFPHVIEHLDVFLEQHWSSQELRPCIDNLVAQSIEDKEFSRSCSSDC